MPEKGRRTEIRHWATEKVNKMKRQFFEKISKTDKPLPERTVHKLLISRIN
jgi:hypothetical protein